MELSLEKSVNWLYDTDHIAHINPVKGGGVIMKKEELQEL